MHVLVDFAAKPEEAQERWTTDSVHRFLTGAVEVTGLTAFGPEVVRDAGNLLVGFQMIAESHISAHLDRASGRGWADVFSCREVSAGKISAVVDEVFLAGGSDGMLSVEILDRGNLPAGKAIE
jgi:S-adenosylmethionine/arginine decarboxylase-like enzyme